MFIVSHFYPNENEFTIGNSQILDMTEWKYTKLMSIILCIITIAIYIILGKSY